MLVANIHKEQSPIFVYESLQEEVFTLDLHLRKCKFYESIFPSSMVQRVTKKNVTYGNMKEYDRQRLNVLPHKLIKKMKRYVSKNFNYQNFGGKNNAFLRLRQAAIFMRMYNISTDTYWTYSSISIIHQRIIALQRGTLC